MPAHLVGDQCHFYFRPGDPPPWYAPDTPEQTEMISKGSGRKKQPEGGGEGVHGAGKGEEASALGVGVVEGGDDPDH